MSWQSIRNRWARLKAALPRPAPSGSVKDGPILSFQALIVSVAAILYFLGWMYLYYYLFEFGIDIFALEIPFYYIFVYSFAVIRHSFQANMAGVLIAASTAILVYGVTRYFVPRAASFVLLAFASSAFLRGHSAAISAARDRSEQLRFDPTSFVEVVFPSDNDVVKTDQHLSRLTKFDPASPATLIIASRDRYFLLLQPFLRGEPDYRPSAKVLELKREDVVALKFKLSNRRRSGSP